MDDSDYARDPASHSADDPANDGARISEMITAATRFTGTANPEACAQAVTQRLLPDLLPHRVGTPASFGFAGFNGRTLADNAPQRSLFAGDRHGVRDRTHICHGGRYP